MVSFFPDDPGTHPPAPASAGGSPLIERDEILGHFPNEMGIAVAIPAATFVFDELALAFDQYRVFDPGFFVTLRVLHRDPRRDDHDRGLAESLFGGPDRMAWSDRFFWGLELANGAKGYGVPLETAVGDFGINPQGGGGDGVMATYDFWVHASPTPEMTIHVAWPARSIPETSLKVDGSGLVEASRVDTHVPGW